MKFIGNHKCVTWCRFSARQHSGRLCGFQKREGFHSWWALWARGALQPDRVTPDLRGEHRPCPSLPPGETRQRRALPSREIYSSCPCRWRAQMGELHDLGKKIDLSDIDSKTFCFNTARDWFCWNFFHMFQHMYYVWCWYERMNEWMNEWMKRRTMHTMFRETAGQH